MLQFITKDNTKYTIEESVQMAIEGGCNWIELSRSLPDGVNLKDIALTIQEICRENDVILTLSSDVELVNELKVFGVHLSKDDMPAGEARELLGPHAIIGVDVETPQEAILLQPADIDYVVVGPYRQQWAVDDYKKFIDTLNEAGCNTAVVASGDIAVDDVAELLAAGVKGIATSAPIIDSDNPVETTRKYLALADNN